MPCPAALLAATALIAAPAAAQRDGATDPAGAQVLVDATPLLLDAAPPAGRDATRDPLPPAVVRRTADGATVTTIAVGGRLAADGQSTRSVDDEPRAAARNRRRPKSR